MTRAGTIPLSDLEWVRIYFNTRKYRSTKANMVKMLAESGGDEMCNGSIFLRNLSPCCHLRVGGVVKKCPDYTAWGISWTTPADFGVKKVPNSDQNYMECVHLLIDGARIEKPHYGADMGGRRPRTAIGVKDGRFAYFASNSGYTPEQLRDTLYSAGWSDAIMMDGGGSTCIMDKDGNGFVGDGRVIPFFLVWKRKSASSTDDTSYGPSDLPKSEPKADASPIIPEPSASTSGASKGDIGATMKAVNVYSKATEGQTKLTTNFKVSEFACKDGSDPVFVSQKLADVLQMIRTHFNAPVTITSGYRTVAHNKKEGGSTNSQHLYGLAADIIVKGHNPTEVGDYARKLMPNYGGVGIYFKKGFTHVDVRDKKSDWMG